MALPIYYSSVNPIANAWFSQKERTMATAILGLAVPIGAALGLLLPLIFMAGENELTPPAEVQKSFHKMNFYQNIYLTVSTLLLLVLIRTKPRNPPSEAALQQAPRRRMDKMVFQVFKNKNFMLISLTFGIFWGANIAMCAVMSPLMKGYGYSPTTTSGLALFFIIGAVVGMFTFGLILDRTHKFLLSLRLVSFLATIGFLIGMIVLPLG